MPDWARISSSLISAPSVQIVVFDEDPFDARVEGVRVGQVQEQEQRRAKQDQDDCGNTETQPRGCPP